MELRLVEVGELERVKKLLMEIAIRKHVIPGSKKERMNICARVLLESLGNLGNYIDFSKIDSFTVSGYLFKKTPNDKNVLTDQPAERNDASKHSD